MTEIYVCRVGIFSAWNSMQLKIFSSLILSKISSRKLVFLFIQIKIHILFFRFVVSEILQTSNYNQNNTIENLAFWWISMYCWVGNKNSWKNLFAKQIWDSTFLIIFLLLGYSFSLILIFWAGNNNSWKHLFTEQMICNIPKEIFQTIYKIHWFMSNFTQYYVIIHDIMWNYVDIQKNLRNIM